MYLELFKLHELPFRLSPDPQFLYLSKQHARAKAYMESTIWFTDGFVVITGEIGAGKTTLIETFLRELQSEVVVAQINQTQLTPTAFLQTVLVQFGFEPYDMKKPEVLATLNEFLMEQHDSGRKVLLIVDEAQNLSEEVLEEIRMLTNLETFTEKLLQIVLVGQPELEQKLKQPQLRQLRQRLTLRAKTHPLTLEETKAYIQQRLRIAGSNGQQIFDPEAVIAIHRYASGIPRVINLLCEHCLVSAFVDQQKIILPAVVDGVARDFDLNDGIASAVMTVPASTSSPEKFDLVEALRSLATLADRLREGDEPKNLPKEGKL